MITDNDQYVFVDGMAKDEDHPHGDLDRIVHDVKLLPAWLGNPVLYGQDIAWLVECIAAREYLCGNRNDSEKVEFRRIDRNAPRAIPIALDIYPQTLISSWNRLLDKGSHLFAGDQYPSTGHHMPNTFKDAYRDILWGYGRYDSNSKLDDPVNNILLKRDDLKEMLTSFSSWFLRQYVGVQLPNDDTQPEDNVFWARMQGEQSQRHFAAGSDDVPDPYNLGYKEFEWLRCDGMFTNEWNYRFQWSSRPHANIFLHIPEPARKIIKSFRIVSGMSVYYSFYNEDRSSGEDSGTSFLVSPPVAVGAQNDYTVNVHDDGMTEAYGIDRRQPRFTPQTSPTHFHRTVLINLEKLFLVADLKDSHTKYM